MRRCVIFGGGELKDIRFTQSLLREDDYIVCADRGYAYCAAMQATAMPRRWEENRT